MENKDKNTIPSKTEFLLLLLLLGITSSCLSHDLIVLGSIFEIGTIIWGVTLGNRLK